MSRRPGKTDLHIHSTVSDGTDSPQSLLSLVRQQGFAVFSVTDHDAVKAAQILRPLLTADDPLFIPGAEFSCRDEQGKYHILAYGFDPDAPALHELVAHGHRLRMNKVRNRLKLLSTEFGFLFPQAEIDRILSLDNPGKPHIGNLMVTLGFAPTKEDAIRDYIDKLPLRNEMIRPEEAIGSILAGGGIPVLAHPCFGSGSDRLSADETRQRLCRLTEYGLQGIEAYYSGFSVQQRTEMLSLADQFDLYVTAGSDYHGTNKTVALGDTGLDEASDYPERLLQFLSECHEKRSV